MTGRKCIEQNYLSVGLMGNLYSLYSPCLPVFHIQYSLFYNQKNTCFEIKWKKKELNHPHVGIIWLNRMEERQKERTLGINRQKQISQPPWAKLALVGRWGTETKGVPLMYTQRALESWNWKRFSRLLNYFL